MNVISWGMARSFGLAALCLCSFLACAHGSEAGDRSLFAAGEFKHEGQGVPSGWLLSKGRPEAFEVVSEAAPQMSPGKSLCFLERPGLAEIVSEPIKIDPSEPVVVSAWVKASGPGEKQGGVTIRLEWVDAGGAAVKRPADTGEEKASNGVYLIRNYAADKWREVSLKLLPEGTGNGPASRKVPADAAAVQVRLMRPNYTLPVWFGTISLRQP